MRSGSRQLTEKLLFDDHNIVNSSNTMREKTLQNSTTGLLKFIEEIMEKLKSYLKENSKKQLQE